MPLADGASAAVPAETLVPPKLLRDGEVVILAVKPSGWYVLLVSWPALAVAALVAVAAPLAAEVVELGVSERTVGLFCLGAAALRLVVACFQWLGRLFVLTNLRLMRIRGIFRVDIFECPLKGVRKAYLSFTRVERMLALGTLQFRADGPSCSESCWVNIARPMEIHQIVNEAISRAK